MSKLRRGNVETRRGLQHMPLVRLLQVRVMPILRVFPRRTNATPLDDYVTFDPPGLFIPEDITEIHVSVTFTYDLEKAHRLADCWSRIAPVKIGGPAFNLPGGEFTPGLYLKEGYVITSRGCPNHCWFCAVPKRETNGLHELEIKDGWNVLDDNVRPDRVLLKVALDTTILNHG